MTINEIIYKLENINGTLYAPYLPITVPTKIELISANITINPTGLVTWN